MEIFVQSPFGTHAVTIQTGWKLKELKEELTDAEGLKCKWAPFFFEGEEIPPGKLLIDTGITGGCTLEVTETGEALANRVLKTKYPTNSWRRRLMRTDSPDNDEFLEALAISGRFLKSHSYLVHLLIFHKRHSILPIALGHVDVKNHKYRNDLSMSQFSGDLLRYAVDVGDPKSVEILANAGYGLGKKPSLDIQAITSSFETLRMLDSKFPVLHSTYPLWCNRVQLSSPGEPAFTYLLTTYSGSTPLYITKKLCEKFGYSKVFPYMSEHPKFASKLFYSDTLTQDEHLTLLEYVEKEKCFPSAFESVTKSHLQKEYFDAAEKVMALGGLAESERFFFDTLLVMSQTDVSFEKWMKLFKMDTLTGKTIDDMARTKKVDHPLLKASSTGNLSVVKGLLSLSPPCDVNFRNCKTQVTALIAAAKKHVDVVRCLLEHKADPSLKTEEGNTARDAATHAANNEIMEMLFAAERKPTP
eukprot:TRINITY_DN6152_c1_g1_i1.p1 TRINITY_DN6152_c1_g1~~TRINITY_DN6152_c1_g1_i1.p1  ORF type:complete len:472 (+),score=74.44 TRINITY_DN6152_c1_g1_i1:65-1480(+)